MPEQDFLISSLKNTGRILSAGDLRRLYFFGLSMSEPERGAVMDDRSLNSYIEMSQQDIEDYLSIKLFRQVYRETIDFKRSDWRSWGFIPTTYPVSEPVSLSGHMNNTKHIDYPVEWLSSKSSSDGRYYRRLNTVPSSGAASPTGNLGTFSGVFPYSFLFNREGMPNYWHLAYITGFDNIPKSILDAVGKLSAINILHQLGDLIAGAGIASRSISIDNLSQSIGTTSSATNSGFGARITGYRKDLARQLPMLYNTYGNLPISFA